VNSVLEAMQALGLANLTNSDPHQNFPVNTKLVASLARKLGIELPANMDLRSKNF